MLKSPSQYKVTFGVSGEKIQKVFAKLQLLCVRSIHVDQGEGSLVNVAYQNNITTGRVRYFLDEGKWECIVYCDENSTFLLLL